MLDPRAANQGFHIVSGTPATALPTSGSVQYSLTGSTKPTIEDGSVAPGSFTGSLGVDFAASKVGLTSTVAIGGSSYALNTSGGAATPATGGFALQRTANLGSGVDVGAFFGQVAVPTGGIACPAGSCRAFVNGFLYGTGGALAGIDYLIEGSDATKLVSGVAAFGAVPTAATSSGNQYIRGYGGGVVGSLDNTTLVSQSNGRVDSFVNGTTTIGRGTNTDRENGVAGAVGWTRWSGGTTTGTLPGTAAPTIAVDGGGGMAYGTIATDLPTSGTATYAMAGATAVVSDNGAVTPGVVRSAGLAVSFSDRMVGFTSVLGVGGSDFTFASTGGTAAPSMPLSAVGTFDGRGNGGRVSGFLGGAGGSNAALAFIVPLPGSTTVNVNGAIGFTRN